MSIFSFHKSARLSFSYNTHRFHCVALSQTDSSVYKRTTRDCIIIIIFCPPLFRPWLWKLPVRGHARGDGCNMEMASVIIIFIMFKMLIMFLGYVYTGGSSQSQSLQHFSPQLLLPGNCCCWKITVTIGKDKRKKILKNEN